MLSTPRRAARFAVIAVATAGWLIGQSGAWTLRAAQSVFRNEVAARVGTAAISGVIVDATTGESVAGALVHLTPGPSQITDAKGRFVFDHLPASDQFVINATKPGYFSGFFESRFLRVAGGVGDSHALIAVAEGQWVRDLRIVMSRPAAVSGRVVDERGEPIVGAYVRVLSRIAISGRPQLVTGQPVRTDDRGVYRIAGLRPGTYLVQMLTVQHAFSSSTTTEAIIGLSAESPAAANASAGSRIAVTDAIADADALNQIVVGRYPIPPRSSDGRLMVYPVTFFPGGTSLTDAIPITLGEGDERVGVDLRVAAVFGARISGVVDGPPESYAGMSLRLMLADAEDLGDGGETATALVGSGGRFTFVNVPEGTYMIDMRGTVAEYGLSGPPTVPRGLYSPPGAMGTRLGSGGVSGSTGPSGSSVRYRPTGQRGYWGRQRVVADGRDVTDVVVTVRKALTLSGRYVWEGRRHTTPNDAGQISAQPTRGTASFGGLARNDPSAPDRFVIEDLLPGEYVLALDAILISDGTRIKSITCGGRDVTYKAIDASSGADVDCVVTFTDNYITVRGKARTDRGSEPVEADVIVFPVERDQWDPLGFAPPRLKGVQVSSNGAYRFESLPAGDYYVIAVPSSRGQPWLDPKFLEAAAPQATRVHFAWGEVVSQDLAVKAIK